MDKNNASTGTYYSGITLFKLLGSIMIMIFHLWTQRFITEDYNYFMNVGQSVVPTFFLISGFLLYDSLNRRSNPLAYLRKRSRNYIAAFVIMQIVVLIQVYIPILLSSGITPYLIVRYIGDVILGFSFAQLWFIPPFVLGTIISGLLFIYKKERKFLYLIVITAIVAAAFYQFHPVWQKLLHMENNENYKYIKSLLKIPNNYITNGVFLIFTGMYLSKHKEVLKKWRIAFWLPPLIALTWLESFVYHKVFLWSPPFNGFMMYPWALFFTVFILKIKKPNLERYGYVLNTFTILMFFLHIFQSKLIGYRLPPIVKCILIVLMNIVITLAVVTFKKILSTKRLVINNNSSGVN
ncbi:MAG: Acyltransferase family [Herbinix sp.]|jgi:hypothetical protein|nr:Acyltransferase family [Herbinix sp.]